MANDNQDKKSQELEKDLKKENEDLKVEESKSQVERDNYKLAMAVQGLGAVCLAVVALLLVLMISTNNVYKYDFTEQKRFTLAPFSVKAVENLNEPVHFTYFLSDSDNEGRHKVDEVMEGYVNVDKNKITYEFIDPRKNPTKAKEMDIKIVGDVVVTKGKKKEKLYDISEEGVTSVLISLANDKKSKIHFLTGHGERGAGQEVVSISKLKKALISEGYQLEELVLSRKDEIPADVANIAIIAPQVALTDKEKGVLDKWLDKGGNIFLALDMDTGDNYKWLLEKFNLNSPEEIVLDIKSAQAGVEPVFVYTNNYDQGCSITKGLVLPTCYKTTRYIKVINKPTKLNLEHTAIVTTDKKCIAVKLKDLQNSASSDNLVPTVQGENIPLVRIVEREIGKTQAELKEDEKLSKEGVETKSKAKKCHAIFAGDADFLSNELFDANQFANKDVVLNMFGWLGGEETNFEIRAKNTSSEPLMISSRIFYTFAVVIIFTIPASIFFYGFSIYRSRR
ncbi:GldG family protein [bacterium]|nr:GldG family protein [bacterium]